MHRRGGVGKTRRCGHARADRPRRARVPDHDHPPRFPRRVQGGRRRQNRRLHGPLDQHAGRKGAVVGDCYRNSRSMRGDGGGGATRHAGSVGRGVALRPWRFFLIGRRPRYEAGRTRFGVRRALLHPDLNIPRRVVRLPALRACTGVGERRNIVPAVRTQAKSRGEERSPHPPNTPVPKREQHDNWRQAQRDRHESIRAPARQAEALAQDEPRERGECKAHRGHGPQPNRPADDRRCRRGFLGSVS